MSGIGKMPVSFTPKALKRMIPGVSSENVKKLVFIRGTGDPAVIFKNATLTIDVRALEIAEKKRRGRIT